MKNFCRKIVLFLLPILVLAGIYEYMLRQIPNEYAYKNTYLTEHVSEIECLVLGSSHSFSDIDPDYFELNTFNAAHSGQSWNYDLEIIRKFGSSLTHLKTVILPVSYFSFFADMNEGSSAWRIKYYNIYYDMHLSNSLVDHTELLGGNIKKNTLAFLDYYLKGKSKMNCTESGWRNTYTAQRSKDLQSTGQKRAIMHTKADFHLQAQNEAYLQELITFCRQKGCKLLLFTPPAYRTYVQDLNKKQLNKTVELAQNYARTQDLCFYVNFLQDPRFSADDFYDGDHLNDAGAGKFSCYLNNYVTDIK